MLTELFVSNLASTRVVHGGMNAPNSGTVETLTVTEADGIFPVVHRGREQFHFKDRNPERSEEIFCCIETNGANWTVIRGAENTRPVPHAIKFDVRQVITSGFLQRLGDGSTTELVNAVTVCGADPTGTIDSSSALADALSLGPVYVPSGVYLLNQPLNILPGSVMLSFGNVVLRPDSEFQGDAAIELVDGTDRTRIENITLDGSALGAGTDVYGIYAETRDLEGELRRIRVTGFPNSGIIVSGSSWTLDHVSCVHNFGSGFELNTEASLFLGCRALGNARYGFTGVYDKELFLACLAKDNRLGDYR
jgi:hypothetical protein